MAKWLDTFKAAFKFEKPQIETARLGIGYSGGTPVHENSAMEVPAFYRGVIYISSQIAKLPWNVKDADNKKVYDRMYNLINLTPNSEMNSMSWRLCMVQNAIVHGNAYAEIERDTLGRPVALWPLDSRFVEPYRTPNGRLIFRVLGASVIRQGEDAWLDPKDIFHLPNFHTKDGIVGQGVIAYAIDTLGIALGANKMAANLFANGGLPSGVIEVEGTLSDDAYERIKQSWKENHSGRRAGGAAVLEQGAKFKPTTMSPDILQFLETRKFSVLDIARFLGLPPTKLYDTDAATFSNQEQSALDVATDTLDAWARRLEMEADVKLLSKQFGGRRTEMDLYAVFRGDMTTRSNYFSKMMQTSSISPNEIRELEGMAPYDGGDRYYLAMNNFTPVDRVDELLDAQKSKGEPKEAPKTEDKPESADDDQLTKAAIKFLERK